MHDGRETYYHPKDLGRHVMGKGNKELWDKFMAYYGAVFQKGSLSEREKALVALGVSLPSDPMPLLHRRLHPGLPGTATWTPGPTAGKSCSGKPWTSAWTSWLGRTSRRWTSRGVPPS